MFGGNLEVGGSLCYHTSISNIVGKLNKDYKPLIVALILAVGGLFVGSIFASYHSGIRKTDALAGSFFIPRAQGAEVDAAALTVTSAPFLASGNGGVPADPGQNVDALYAQGAIKDSGVFVVFSGGSGQVASGMRGAGKPLAYGVIYQVAAGDTLSSIASQFNVSENRIIQFNPSVNFSALIPGISIIIPGRNDINAFTVQG